MIHFDENTRIKLRNVASLSPFVVIILCCLCFCWLALVYTEISPLNRSIQLLLLLHAPTTAHIIIRDSPMIVDWTE